MRWIGKPNHRTGNALEITEKCLSVGQKAIVLAAMLSALLGSVLIGLYCFHLSRTPQDISVNDAFVLLLTSISFGLVYIVGLFYSAASNIWLLKGLHQLSRGSPKVRQPKAALNYFPWFMSLTVFVIFLVAFILLATSQRELAQDMSKLMMAFWIGGFIIAIPLCFRLSENQKSSQSFGSEKRGNSSGITSLLKSAEVLVFAAGAVLPFALGTWTVFLDVIMVNAGIRIPNVALIVNEENLAYLTSISKAAGAELKTCPISSTKNALVWPTDILWHGIGSVSYVKIRLPNTTSSNRARSLVVDLDRKGVRPVKSNDSITYSCSTQ